MNNNPFLATLVIPYVKVIKRDVPMGRIAMDQLADDDSFNVEQQRSTRIYRSIANFNELLTLRANAIQLLMWIIYNTAEDVHYTKLDEAKLCIAFDCSDRKVQRMRAELIRVAILAKKEANEYWINPRFFTTGNRLTMYPEHTVCVKVIQQPK